MSFFSRFPLALALAQPVLAGTIAHPKAQDLSALPPEVSRAVAVSAKLGEGGGRREYPIEVLVETRGGFKVYADRLNFWVETPTGAPEWRVEIQRRPTATQFVDPVSHVIKEGFKGQNLFELSVRAPDGLDTMPDSLVMVVGFQACSEKLCLLPVSVRLPVTLKGTAPAKKAEAPRTEGAQGLGILDSLQLRLKDSGSLSPMTLLILFLAGLITAFTPCVYPLYPLTLGIFSRWSQSRHSSPFTLALAYCGGLTLSYAAFGWASAVSGSVFGSLTQTPAFLIGVGVLILLSAVFFSGIWTFPMPDFLLQLVSKAGGPSEEKSTASLAPRAALMGAGLGIVASPCVGPVLVVLLAWLQSSQAQAATGFFLLTAFGAGMSFPFLVLAHFILKAGRRPNIGRYTPYAKYVGTALMLVAGASFTWQGVRILPALRHEAQAKYPVLALADWKHDTWTVMDFRAEWCAACHELEDKTFSAKGISPLFESGEWKMVRIDLTEATDANEALAKSFEVVSLPSVLIAAPGGTICKSQSLYGFEEPEKFLERLKRAQTDCGPR